MTKKTPQQWTDDEGQVETIADAFGIYRRRVMPPDAGPVQVHETERAFFAAAFWMLMFMQHGIGSPEMSEDRAVSVLERMRSEAEAYLRQQANTPEPTPPPVEQGSYNVRSTQVEAMLRAMGREWKERMPPGWGFTVLMFSYGKTGLPGEGEEGAVFYLSTADRADMVKVMADFIKRNTQ